APAHRTVTAVSGPLDPMAPRTGADAGRGLASSAGPSDPAGGPVIPPTAFRPVGMATVDRPDDASPCSLDRPHPDLVVDDVNDRDGGARVNEAALRDGIDPLPLDGHEADGTERRLGAPARPDQAGERSQAHLSRFLGAAERL